MQFSLVIMYVCTYEKSWGNLLEIDDDIYCAEVCQ